MEKELKVRVKKIYLVIILLVLTSCGTPDYCNEGFKIGESVDIKGIDSCNCVVSYARYCSVNLICKDDEGKITKLKEVSKGTLTIKKLKTWERN